MAIKEVIIPGKPAQKGGFLGSVLGVAGGIIGGIAGGITGGPGGAVAGASTGMGIGATIGNMADPGSPGSADRAGGNQSSIERRLSNDPQAMIAQINESLAAAKALPDQQRAAIEPFLIAAKQKAGL